MSTAQLEAMMSLKEASEKIGLTVGQLRRAIDRGDLTPRRLGNLIFVTETDLREMMTRCRENRKDRASTSTKGNGSSETASPSVALDAAKARLMKLAGDYATTSQRTRRDRREPSARVIPYSGKS